MTIYQMVIHKTLIISHQNW